MRFEIQHVTDYRYAQPASEAYVEARLTPPERPWQRILLHEIDFRPAASRSRYTDYFGNAVDFYSMTLRHERLVITNKIRVETSPPPVFAEALTVTIAEARQLFTAVLPAYFDFVQPTDVVPLGMEAVARAREHLASRRPLGEALEELNRAIFESFEYVPGSTDNSTPLEQVWAQRRGVCQDYAHVMLSILRAAGLPARYVCGYIETAAPDAEGPEAGRLVGAVATHAWVEVLVPGLEWMGLDPTNCQWCGERHVSMAFGRDFRDAAPVRGTFKGSAAQRMKVRVSMIRKS